MTPLVLAVLLAAADPGAGQSVNAQPASTAAAPAKPAKPAADPDKLVCRSEEQIGTRVRVRSCKTQAAWDQQEEAVRQYFQDAGDNGGIHTAHVSSGAPGG